MRVEIFRYEASVEEDKKFIQAMNNAVNDPPEGYFYTDMKFAMAAISGTLWQEVIIIYMEIPT